MNTITAFTIISCALFVHDVRAVKVSGRLDFPDGVPVNIPDGSHLHVTLQDANIMDVDAKDLGKFTHRFKDHKHTG